MWFQVCSGSWNVVIGRSGQGVAGVLLYVCYDVLWIVIWLLGGSGGCYMVARVLLWCCRSLGMGWVPSSL